MSFLYPTFLWALGALAIPIIVHFFQFRRAKKVYFTRVALLRQLEAQTQAFRSIKQWVLLVLRLVLLACLILAFAQPQWRGSTGTGGVVSLFLDNSRSMENPLKNTSLLDDAVVEIDDALARAGDVPRFQWWTHQSNPQYADVMPASAIQSELTSLSFAAASQSLDLMLQKQQLAAQKSGLPGGKSFFWFSDFQQSTTQGPWGTLAADETLHLIPRQGSQNQNVWIDSVWLVQPFIRLRETNQLAVRVRNQGPQAVSQMPLRLSLNDRSVATVPVDIPANGTQDVTISFSIRAAGLHVGLLHIEDPKVVFDNDFHLVLQAAPKLEIAHFIGDGELPAFIPAVFGDDSLFVYRRLPSRQADPGQLKRYSLVILEGVTQLSPPMLAGLLEAMREGLSVVWVPSEGTLDPKVNQALFGGKVKEQVSSLLTLEEPKAKEVFFRGIFDQSLGGQTSWQLPQAQAIWRWAAPSETLLTLRDGSPLLQRQRQAKQGSLYVWSTSFQKDRGSFGEHALFPAVFLKIAMESAAAKPLAYRLDQPSATVFLPGVVGQPTIRLEGKGGEFTPTQSWLGSTWSFTWPSNAELPPGRELRAGMYRLVADNREVGRIAVNEDRRESFLAPIPLEELAKQVKGEGTVVIHTDTSWKSLLLDDAKGRPLWWYFVLLALLFALAEGILGRYWHQKG